MATVEALWKSETQKDLIITHFDVPVHSTVEEMCVIALDLVEDHHSSLFISAPWFEIQIHGCEITQKLAAEFKKFGKITIAKQDYGFNVIRLRE